MAKKRRMKDELVILRRALEIAAEDFYRATPLVKDQREDILRERINEWLERAEFSFELERLSF